LTEIVDHEKAANAELANVALTEINNDGDCGSCARGNSGMSGARLTSQCARSDAAPISVINWNRATCTVLRVVASNQSVSLPARQTNK
jgi:hypothetical protein